MAPATLSFAQNYASGYQTAVPIGQDSAGNIFVTGVFDGEIDVDPSDATFLLQTAQSGTFGHTGSDLYVAKYAPDGSLLWARSWGGVPGSGTPSQQESARDLIVDPAGNVFVLAEFDTTAAGLGGSGPINAMGAGSKDTVVLKFDGVTGDLVSSFGNQGALQWGGSGQDRAGRLGLGDTAELFITGSYDSPDARLGTDGTFPPPALANGDEVYVLKVSAITGVAVTAFGTGGLLHFGTPSADAGGRPLFSGGALFLENYSGKNGSVLKLDGNFGNPVAGFGINSRVDIANLGGVALDNSDRLLATGGIPSAGGYLKRFDPITGSIDTSFAGDGTLDFGTAAQFGQSIAVDSFGRITVAGSTKADPTVNGKYFLLRANDAGTLDPSFGTNGRLVFATTGRDAHREIRVSVDASGYIAGRGFFSGATDIDPTAATFAVSAAAPSPTAGHPDLDTFTFRVDPNGVDASNPFSYADASGDVVRIAVTGTGSLRITPGTTPGVDIEKIETLNTDATTRFAIKLSKNSVGTTTIASIVTPGANQDLGTITLGKNIILGDGVAGGDAALKITGKATRVTLTDVNPHAVLDFGEGLSYLDTYTNQPNLTIRNILGDGVVIDVTGDGTPGGIGGGGLGKIVVNNWMGAGTIKTTQSVKSFRQKFGDCYVVFELDKDELGESTKANIGSMSIPNGAWGSSGSEIEGECGSFNCAAFLAGATVTAGNIKSLLVKNGPYAGTITLKDPSAAGLGSVKVNGDFTGYVDSASSVRNIRVAGDFMGSLLAASIGSISAFSFDGTTTGDLFGDPLRHQLVATSGSLGLIKTTGGGMKNFEIAVFTTFSGFKISTGTGATVDTTGLDNVKVLAAAIGNVAVSLKAAIGAGPLTLSGIKDSVFESETTMGAITSSHAVSGSLFAAATTMGNIGIGSTSFPAEGVSTSRFLAGVNLGGDGALDGDEIFLRAGKIGNVTVSGPFLTTTIAAGINPVDGIFGNGNDIAGTGASLPGKQKAIGKVVLGAGAGTAVGAPTLAHTDAIEGQKITSLKVNGVAIPVATLPKYLRIGGAETASDVLVRQL